VILQRAKEATTYNDKSEKKEKGGGERRKKRGRLDSPLASVNTCLGVVMMRGVR